MGEVTRCGICGSAGLYVILDMGLQPLAERHGDHRRYPLRLVECQQCFLVQLDYIVDQAEVFPPDHPYATGNTKAMREHFARLAAHVNMLVRGGDVVVDIGANDGTFLSFLRPTVRRIGVEPTAQAVKLGLRGIEVYRAFFTAELAGLMRGDAGQAKVVTAFNVLAHVPDPHDFMEGVVGLLADDGEFITENHDLDAVTGGLQIDTVYHEHLRYYSVASLSYLLMMHGLDVRELTWIPTHGGSFRVTAVKRLPGLRRRADAAMGKLRTLLHQVTEGGALVYGVGAATRAVPLLHKAGIENYLACVCEISSSAKIGHTMPGTPIPIVNEQRLIDDQPPYALLFAWHIADDLIPKLRTLGYKGKFIIPLPEPRITDG